MRSLDGLPPNFIRSIPNILNPLGTKKFRAKLSKRVAHFKIAFSASLLFSLCPLC